MSIRALLSAASSISTSTLLTVDIFGDGSGKALYNLNGNANDNSGNYNGTPTNMTYVAGKYNQCGAFNGSMITSAVNFWGMSTTTGRTLSFWIKAATPAFVIPVSCSSGNGYFQSVSNGSTSMDYYDTSNNIIGNTGVVLDNTWHHIVLSQSSTFTKVYRDGVQSSTSAVIGGINNVNTCFGTLQNNVGSIYKLVGNLDQIRVLSKAVSAAEALALFNEI